MDIGTSPLGFSDFEVELEDFEVVKAGSSISRILSVGSGGSILSVAEARDGIVYFQSADTYIYALSSEDGSIIWKFKTDGIMAGNSPELHEDTLYAGNLNGSLYAVNAKNGKLIWKVKVGKGVTTKPLYYNNRVYFVSLDGNLYCVEALSGKEVWRFRTGKYIYYSPSEKNGKIYFASYDGNVYCLDWKTGKELWRFKTGDEIQCEMPSKVYKNRIYFASMDNNVYSLDAETGREIWRFATGKYGNCFAPIVYRDYVFHASRDGVLYALSLEGKVKWHFRTGGPVGLGVLILKGRVHLGSEDGNIYCLEIDTGKKLWSFRVSGPAWNPPIEYKNKLYFGSWDCNFYCISLQGEEIWRFATSDKTICKVDPPYKYFEVVVKKEGAGEESGIEDKYEVNVTMGFIDEYDSGNEYQVKVEYQQKMKY